MSSSYKQKKLKTLATRKKTRKRRIVEGLTPDDDSGRLLQPPSTRDPRWKKPSIEVVVADVIKSKRQKKTEKKRRKLAVSQNENVGKDDSIEIAQQEFVSNDDKPEGVQSDEIFDNDARFELLKTPLWLCSSSDNAVAKAVAKHTEIRCMDKRQKAKVLILVDTRSMFKLVKKKMNIHTSMIKMKSKRGVGSGKKPEMGYKTTGLVKTPLDCFKSVNKTVLEEYKSGKVSSILAEDLTFYPYTEFKVQHVIFVAKQASSAINLDRNLLRDIQLHLFVVGDTKGGISEDDLKALQAAYDVTVDDS
ncbi:hypothetical protein Plhal703r1_c11g0058051 [Plasmopara halstedii]